MRPEQMTILIPAAGASRRMLGRDKLLEDVDGQPLLARAVRTALATGAEVFVTLPFGPQGAARRAALQGLGVVLIAVPDPTEGMAASLRAGAAAHRDGRPLMILLPDLPDLEASDLSAMIAAYVDGPTEPVLRASSEDGAWGHPVILPARLIPTLAQVRGDQGARALLAGVPVRPFPLPGTRAITDLDTPEAWAEWRASRPS